MDKVTRKGRNEPSTTECGFMTQSFKGLLSLVYKIRVRILQKKKVAWTVQQHLALTPLKASQSPGEVLKKQRPR